MNDFIIKHDPLIRVFAIDNEAIALWGLAGAFRKSGKIRLAGTSYSVDDGISKMIKLDFDIILLDLHLKKSDPFENVKKLKGTFPDKPIVIFTVEDFHESRINMFKAGVSAYILKTAYPHEISSILTDVANGKKLLDLEKIPKEKLSHYAFLRQKFEFDEFQVKVLFLLSEGFQEKHIADELKTSISHINKSLMKLRSICNAKTNCEMIYTILS